MTAAREVPFESQLRARARRIAREVEQIRVDAEHWNRLHPDEEPINPDPDGELDAVYAFASRVLQEVGR